MNKVIGCTVACFILVVASLLSCKKSDLRGCNSKTQQFVCTINGANFKADSSFCRYDTLAGTYFIFTRNKDEGTVMLFSIKYPLENFDIPLKGSVSPLSGKVDLIYRGQTFSSTTGNFGLEIDPAKKTICGQFFYSDVPRALNVSRGKFTAITYVRD